MSEEFYSMRGPKPTGYFSQSVEGIIDVALRQVSNCTVSDGEFGDKKDQSGRYDGCMGDLQQNKTDLAIMPVKYPVTAFNVTSTVFMASKTTIFSTYSNRFDSLKTDVIEFVAAFDKLLWMTILTAFLILVFLQVSSIRMKRKRRSVLKLTGNVMTSASLKQYSSLDVLSKRFTVRLSLLMILIFGFQIHFYLISMIKTEMVVQKPPDTISTYEELVNHPKSKPYFLKASSDYWAFRDADKDSPSGRIWKKAVENGLEKCIFGFDYKRVISAFAEMSKKEAVFIIPEFLIDGFTTNACSFYRGIANQMEINSWHKTDPEATDHIMGFAVSKQASKEVTRKIDIISRRVMEHHIMPQIIKTLNFFVAKNSGKPEVRDCMANEILYPEHELESVNLRHYSGLWKFLFVSCIAVIFVFVCELIARGINSYMSGY